MDIDKIQTKSEKWINKHHPKLYEKVSLIKIGNSWKEKLYINQYNLKETPKCYCGGDLKFLSYKKGYRLYCSNKCTANSKKVKEQKKKTNLEKYGVEIPMKSESVKENLKKTILEKYGVDNISKLYETKEKVKQTNLEKYGVEYVSKLDRVKEKLSKSISKRQKEIIKTQKANRKEYIIEKTKKYNIDFVSEKSSIYTFNCKDCNDEFIIHKNTLNDRIRNKNTICTKCNKVNSSSNSQDLIYEYIKSIYDGVVLKNVRTVIKGELDIYIPDLNLAFEYNGLYWHSDVFKDRKYHINKTKSCYENDIKLIHIWEDEWINKEDIVMSRIKNLLGGSKIIYARKCKIAEIDKKTSDQFLKDNHIQGSVISKNNIGLYYDDNLVSVMTFGSLRKNLGYCSKEGHHELLRFCNKLGTSVVGGASKLLKYFIRNYKPVNIISYADISWSNGSLYKKLGFDEIGITDPNYFWVKNGIRYNRFSFRKDILVKEGYDPNLSESEIMRERGYYKIYNCGNLKFELKIKNSI